MKNQSFSTNFQVKWYQIWSFWAKITLKPAKNCFFNHVPKPPHHFSHHFHTILRYMWCRYIILQWNYTTKFITNMYLHHFGYTPLRYIKENSLFDVYIFKKVNKTNLSNPSRGVYVWTLDHVIRGHVSVDT